MTCVPCGPTKPQQTNTTHLISMLHTISTHSSNLNRHHSTMLLSQHAQRRRMILRQGIITCCMSSKPTRELMLSLERSVGNSHGSDTALRSTQAFHAEVFPDLPIATTWANLWKAIRYDTLRLNALH